MYYISYIIYYHVKKENIKKRFNVKVNDYVYLISTLFIYYYIMYIFYYIIITYYKYIQYYLTILITKIHF